MRRMLPFAAAAALTGLAWAGPAPAPRPAPPAASAVTLSPTSAGPTPVATPAAARRAYEYPAAPKGSTIDDFHGTPVADPYRGLEKADEPATVAWVTAENALTRRLLDRPEHSAIEKRITELYDYPKITAPQH